MSRVVITGVGAITPLGNSVEETWSKLLEGKHGFTLEHWFEGKANNKRSTC